MVSLSLPPRMDLFHFAFPKDFIPEELNEKYTKVLNKEKNVIVTPIDYLNESIQEFDFPGISDLLVEQQQRSVEHPANVYSQKGLSGHRVNIEPQRTNVSYSPANMLSLINGEFTVRFRKDQGLYNYFLMYETIFHKVLKQYATNEHVDPVFYLDILDSTGKIMGRVSFFQPRINGIDGFTFSYNKLERQTDTFEVKFRYNNINFDFLEEDLYPNQIKEEQ